MLRLHLVVIMLMVLEELSLGADQEGFQPTLLPLKVDLGIQALLVAKVQGNLETVVMIMQQLLRLRQKRDSH